MRPSGLIFFIILVASEAEEYPNIGGTFHLCECDIKKCNPDLYKGKKGVIAIARSKKALAVIKRIEIDLNKLKKILK